MTVMTQAPIRAHRLGQIAPLRSLLSSNGVPSRNIANMIVSILRPVATRAFLYRSFLPRHRRSKNASYEHVRVKGGMR